MNADRRIEEWMQIGAELNSINVMQIELENKMKKRLGFLLAHIRKSA